MFLFAITGYFRNQSYGGLTNRYKHIDESSDEDEDEEITHTNTAENSNINLCVVCLGVRETILIFMPCKHANSCGVCNTRIKNSVKHVQFVVLQFRADLKYYSIKII